MGRKRRFIGKTEEQQHFHLLHRSQTDAAYSNEENPSAFVLVPSNNLQQKASAQQKNIFEKSKDHINSLGFRNDGYDYSQHLKVMGGGKFIGRDGKVHTLDFQNSLEIPKDALPSEEELDRDFQAITISHECMDEDLKAALFNDSAEGEFEELQDDFIEIAMQEPVQPDFDFDAHIAKLIERSERMAKGDVGPRGWIVKAGVDEISDEDFSQYADSEEGDRIYGSVKGVTVGGVITKEQQALIDEQFEKTLLEYDDDAIGDLEHKFYDEYEEESEEDEDDQEVDGGEGTLTTRSVRGGAAGGPGPGVIEVSNKIFELAIEEYIQSGKDAVMAEGVVVQKKGSRSIYTIDGEESDVIDNKDIDLHKEFQEQVTKQEESIEVIEELGAGIVSSKEIEEGQDYLRQTVVRDEWDCETILSTYSTLDNHPSIIKEPVRLKPKSVASSRPGVSQSVADSGFSSSSTGGRGYRGKVRQEVSHAPPKTYTIPTMTNGDKASKILLSGNLQLPEGFNSTGRSVKKTSRLESSINDLSKLSLQENRIEEGSDEDSCSDTDEEEDGSEKWEVREKPEKRENSRKNETPEEKKARKLKIKEEKRSKREFKKQLKIAYKTEYVKMNNTTANAQSIDGVSMFKYTI